MKALAIAFGTLVCCGSVLAQQPREKSKELEALGQYIGAWTSEVTSKPAVWTPKEVKYRTSNHAEFVLNGWYLQHIEVSHEVADPSKVGKALFVWTFDPSAKKYVGWAFHSFGGISHVTSTWDAASKTFTHAETEPPPDTGNGRSLRSESRAADD